MNALKLAFLRHGETTLLTQGMILRGRTDDPLTAMGWEQMHQGFDNGIQENIWQAIITSPLIRCADFAKVKAEQYNLPLFIVPELQEIDFGDWECQMTADLFVKFPNDMATWLQTPTQFTPPNGESMIDFAKRIDMALVNITDICQNHNFNNICVITHGGVIKYLYGKAQKLDLNQILSIPAELGEVHRFNYRQGILDLA